MAERDWDGVWDDWDRAADVVGRARAFQAEMDEAGFGRQGAWPLVAYVGGGTALHAAHRVLLHPEGVPHLTTRCGKEYRVVIASTHTQDGPSCRRCLQLLAHDTHPDQPGGDAVPGGPPGPPDHHREEPHRG